jgi:hypothetical protein
MFIYITFAAVWSGRYYIIAIDYDSYVILKSCTFATNERKYVHCENFTKYDKLNPIRRFAHLRKASIRFMNAVRLSVRPNRITRLPSDGLKTMLIFEDIYKTMVKIQIRLIPDNINEYFTEKTNIYTYLRKK